MTSITDTTFKTKFILYHQDTRAPGRKQYNVTQWLFGDLHEETALNVNNLVCSYFQVSEEWDKRLFDSMYLGSWGSFEFARKNTSVICGVKIFGKKEHFVRKNWNETPTLIDENQLLFVSYKGADDQEVTLTALTANDIKKNHLNDDAIVALFNSHSFGSLKQKAISSSEFRTMRTLNSKQTLNSKI